VTFGEIRHGAAIVSTAKLLAVRRLIAERKVGVAFQPIWNLERGTILAYEALARPDDEYGLAGPQEAFDIAERIGRVPELDALCRAAIFARGHELPADVLLFLNLSPQSLDHSLLAGDALVQAVTAAGLTPARVVLEITERSLARPAVVSREARRLRDLGFRIALDDVGAGSTGLEMLRRVPVDYLKIDREIVAGALTDATARSVLAAILAFAREAETRVIAEGIESEAMLDLLDQAGRARAGRPVYGVQGYLTGRPSPIIAQTSIRSLLPRRQAALPRREAAS
jgi:EAL domain-containing protein (putative c-di-GMP-specific phosphodiesterase class I)